MVVQWLRLGAPNWGSLDSIPGGGIRSHVLKLRVHILQRRPGTTKYTHTHTHIYILHAHIYPTQFCNICIHINIYTHIYISRYTCVYIYIYICIHTHYTLWGLWVLVCTRFCLSPPSISGRYGIWFSMWFRPSYRLAGASPLLLDVQYLFLVGSNILLSMVVQQRVVIMEFSKEKMSARPSTLLS